MDVFGSIMMHDLLVHTYNKQCCNTSNKMKDGGTSTRIV